MPCAQPLCLQVSDKGPWPQNWNQRGRPRVVRTVQEVFCGGLRPRRWEPSEAGRRLGRAADPRAQPDEDEGPARPHGGLSVDVSRPGPAPRPSFKVKKQRVRKLE